MNELIDILKKIKNCLFSLQKILSEEEKMLLNNNENIKQWDLIIEKKNILEQFQLFQKDRLFLEQKHNIFAPYHNDTILHTDWSDIMKQCILLKSLNLENNKILNEKFYVNQHFLELLSSSSKDSIYDSDGNLKF